MARKNLGGLFWLLVAIVVVSLPLACSSSTDGAKDGPGNTGAEAAADALTGG